MHTALATKVEGSASTGLVKIGAGARARARARARIRARVRVSVRVRAGVRAWARGNGRAGGRVGVGVGVELGVGLGRVRGRASTGLVLKAKAAQSNVARSRLAADAGSRRTRAIRGKRPGGEKVAGLERCST